MDDCSAPESGNTPNGPVFVDRRDRLGQDLIDLRQCKSRFVVRDPSGRSILGDWLIFYLMPDGRWIRHRSTQRTDFRHDDYQEFDPAMVAMAIAAHAHSRFQEVVTLPRELEPYWSAEDDQRC
jgi:hypothetical protein